MASSSKKRTTMAKLARENKLRERRVEKQARKEARRDAAADAPPTGDGSDPIWPEPELATTEAAPGPNES
jgi:hypothetical protein